MTIDEVLNQRVHTQRLAGVPFVQPEDMVKSLCAVQAQDFGNAKWSVGQRAKTCSDADVGSSFDGGRILRTHVLRPTWHFVAPADIRWMLKLTAPHVKNLNAYMYRKLELDEDALAKSRMVLSEALWGGKHLTRLELEDALRQAGIVADKLRLGYFMMDAELEGLVCSGAVRGKQQAYALLEERVPPAKSLTREEALAELTSRFFVGHGPASAKDYVRWSGLSVADANKGLELIKHDLEQENVNGKVLWFDASVQWIAPVSNRAFLLPEYDECVLTYPEISFPDMPWTRKREDWNDFFYRPVIINLKRAGTWRRRVNSASIDLEAYLFTTLDAEELGALETEVERYSAYMNLPVTLTFL